MCFTGVDLSISLNSSLVKSSFLQKYSMSFSKKPDKNYFQVFFNASTLFISLFLIKQDRCDFLLSIENFFGKIYA